jgi:hypothetical protein
MVAETVSLGVLSLPAAVAGLGIVPYVLTTQRYKRFQTNGLIARFYACFS